MAEGGQEDAELRLRLSNSLRPPEPRPLCDRPHRPTNRQRSPNAGGSTFPRRSNSKHARRKDRLRIKLRRTASAPGEAATTTGNARSQAGDRLRSDKEAFAWPFSVRRSFGVVENLILASAAQRPTSTSDCQEKAEAQVKIEHQPAPPKSTAALRSPPGSPTDRHRSPLLIFIFPRFTFYISSPTAPTKPPHQSPPPARPATAGAGSKGKRPKAQRPPYACRPSPLSRERSFAPNFPLHTPLLIPA